MTPITRAPGTGEGNGDRRVYGGEVELPGRLGDAGAGPQRVDVHAALAVTQRQRVLGLAHEAGRVVPVRDVLHLVDGQRVVRVTEVGEVAVPLVAVEVLLPADEPVDAAQPLLQAVVRDRLPVRDLGALGALERVLPVHRDDAGGGPRRVLADPTERGG